MAEAVLTAEGLAAGYGPARVLFGVDLSLAAGEVAALLGRNGAGKSTTLKALMGLLPPRAGRVRLLGRDVTGWPPHRVARAGLGWVPEDRRVFADLTVDENLAVGRKPGPGPAWTPERLFAVFPDLAAMRGRRAGRMSGGEQQMLAVARTLAGGPLAVLLDEPSEGLAPLVVERMAGAVAEMRRAGCAVLLCEQNLDFAASVADRALVLERGAVVHEGAVDSPEVEALLAAA